MHDLLLEALRYASLDELKGLRANAFEKSYRRVSQEAFEQALLVTNSYWSAAGAELSSQPHILLASKRHSTACRLVGKMISVLPMMSELLGRDLVDLVRVQTDELIDWVFGSATSATALADAAVEYVGGACRHGILSKDVSGQQFWVPDQDPILAQDTVFQIEDVFTTGGQAVVARHAVVSSDPSVKMRFLPYTSFVVDQSFGLDENEVCGSRVLSLFRYRLPTYLATDCPACKAGSVALPIKDSRFEPLFWGNEPLKLAPCPKCQALMPVIDGEIICIVCN